MTEFCYIFCLTSLISFQDFLQHFKGVGLSRWYTGLFILLDHLVHLRIPVKPVHGKIRGQTAARERNYNTYFNGKLIEITLFLTCFLSKIAVERQQFSTSHTLYLSKLID